MRIYNDKNTLKKLKRDLLYLGFFMTALGSISMNINAEEKSDEETYKIVRNSNQDLESLSDIITYYSNVFGIREDIVYDTLEYNTNCYENIEENNMELEVLNTVRDIYYNCKDYGYEKDKIKTNGEYAPTKSPEELIEHYSELIGVNKYIALAICYNECGSDVNSKNYRKNHNPAGIGPHMYFENAEVGIIYYINMLKNGYNCNTDSDESFFGRVAKVYCPEGTSGWISHTSSFYNSIIDNYYHYAPEVKEKIEFKETNKQYIKK